MTVGNLTLVFISAVTTLAALATVMTWLGFSINGRKHAARIWAWLRKSRTEREALECRIGELDKHVNLLSKLVQTQSKMRDAEHRELELLVADLKQRADADGKRLTNVEGNIVHDAQELDALGTELKQVEKQLVDYARMLMEAREQITKLMNHDLVLLRASAVNHDELDKRVRKLEGLPPAEHVGKPPVSDTHNADADGPGFYP